MHADISELGQRCALCGDALHVDTVRVIEDDIAIHVGCSVPTDVLLAIVRDRMNPEIMHGMVERYKTGARSMTEYSAGDDVIRAGIEAALGVAR